MPALAGIIVVVTLAAIVSGRVPAVLALVCALVLAGFIGIATPAELFAGLSNGGVITIAAMLVIAKGVFYTGVVSRVVSSDEPTAIQEPREDDDIMVVAAETTRSLRKTVAKPGDRCLVSAQGGSGRGGVRALRCSGHGGGTGREHPDGLGAAHVAVSSAPWQTAITATPAMRRAFRHHWARSPMRPGPPPPRKRAPSPPPPTPAHWRA